MSATTTSTAPAPLDTAIYQKNLSALEEFLPKTVESLRESCGPASLKLFQGRDAAGTFVWSDDEGRLCWLGRTTMPTVRAEALIEGFNAGDGNVLMVGIGQGAEIDLLRNRLSPHQAIMVVEEVPWAVQCALRLYHFSSELREGRLLIFVGPDAWQEFERFLTCHHGFMEPLRILSWPWFDAMRVAEVSRRLSEMNSRLATFRATAFAESVTRKITARPRAHPPVVAILSTIADPRIRRSSEVLEFAAESLGWTAERFVLQNPAWVHPLGIQQALNDLSPSICILLDVAPSMLPHPLPDVPAFVLCSHAGPLSEQWLAQVGPDVRIGLVNESQQRQAVRCGIPESNILLVPPAAQTGLAAGSTSKRPGQANVLVVADYMDPSARAAGLHLASHCRLWDAATAIITSQCDRYDDDQAAEVLAAALEQAQIQLSSDEVRAGLVERIRLRLGPAIVRLEYLRALRKESVEYDIVGCGWESDPENSSHCRGNWPPPHHLRNVLERYRAVIVFDPVGQPFEPLLDAWAAGLAGFHRVVGEPRTGVEGVDWTAGAYSSRSDLLQCAGRAKAPASSLAETINARHTWAHRLQSIVRFCQVD